MTGKFLLCNIKWEKNTKLHLSLITHDKNYRCILTAKDPVEKTQLVGRKWR